MKAPPSTSYNLRSHAQESATADGKPKQQTIDKTESKHSCDKMIEENIKPTGSSPKIEKKNSQTGQNEPSDSILTAENEVPVEKEPSAEKEDHNISPSELSEPNSSTGVAKPTESQIPTKKSNETLDDERKQEKEEIRCPKCGQTFERRSQLTEHLKTYSTDQATCPICNKGLTSSNSRDRHLLIHSGERPYECELCKHTFTTNGNMHRHYKRHFVKNKQKGKISNENENSEEQESSFKKEEVSPQADVCKETTETPKFLSDMDRCRKNYFQSLGLRRKSSIPELNVNQELESDTEGRFEKLIEKRKKLTIWDEGRKAESPQITTPKLGNIRRKKVKENTGIGSNKTNNSIKLNFDGMPDNEPTDVQDLAGITEIISNVQPKTSKENQTITNSSSTGDQHSKHIIKQSPASKSCKHTTNDKSTQKKHSPTHKRSGKFKCKTCSFPFTNKANAQRHVRELHGLHDRESISGQIIFLKEETDLADEKVFTCKYCPSIFDNEQALQHHLRSNECKMKPYYCAICGIGSSTKNNCFRHLENKHPEIFTNQMTSEEKNRVKELNMRQTVYTPPRPDEDNKSKEIEAAEGLCRLSENRQDTFMEAISATEKFHDNSCSTLAYVKDASMSGGTDTTVIVDADSIGTGPSITTGTVSSTITGTMSTIVRTSPSANKSSSEFLEDKPLDLSVNPLDLSCKKPNSPDFPESNLETVDDNENQMSVSKSNGHSQSDQNFGKNDGNLQQQKYVQTKSIKNFKCKYCDKTFSTNSNLQRHLVNLHKHSSITHLDSPHIPIRRDLLRECSINSSIKHSSSNEIKNSSSLLTNSKFSTLYERGTGSDTENDLASIPSIQSTVNQGIHIAHQCSSTVYSVISHIHRKRTFSDLQSTDFSFPAWNPRKKHARTAPRSPTEAACSPISIPQNVVTFSMDRLNDEGSIEGRPATNPENYTSAYDFSKSTHDQRFNVRLAESAEPLPSKDTDLICCYCSCKFSSKEHVHSHIKELHYLEHNNTLEVPDEKIRWKKERFSKIRQ